MSRWREEPQLLYDEQAREFNNSLFYYDEEEKRMMKEKLDYIVAGLDAWPGSHRDRENKNLIDFYEAGGLKETFIPAIVDRKLRKATMHEYLKPIEGNDGVYAKLQIFSTCEYLISVLPQLVNDPRDPEKVADLSDIDNPYDSIGYLLISRHAEKSEDHTKPQKTFMQQHKEKMFNQVRHKRRRY